MCTHLFVSVFHCLEFVNYAMEWGERGGRADEACGVTVAATTAALAKAIKLHLR